MQAIIILVTLITLVACATFKTFICNKACNKGKLPFSSNFALIKTPFKA